MWLLAAWQCVKLLHSVCSARRRAAQQEKEAVQAVPASNGIPKVRAVSLALVGSYCLHLYMTVDLDAWHQANGSQHAQQGAHAAPLAWPMQMAGEGAMGDQAAAAAHGQPQDAKLKLGGLAALKQQVRQQQQGLGSPSALHRGPAAAAAAAAATPAPSSQALSAATPSSAPAFGARIPAGVWPGPISLTPASSLPARSSKPSFFNSAAGKALAMLPD